MKKVISIMLVMENNPLRELAASIYAFILGLGFIALAALSLKYNVIVSAKYQEEHFKEETLKRKWFHYQRINLVLAGITFMAFAFLPIKIRMPLFAGVIFIILISIFYQNKKILGRWTVRKW